MTLSNRFGVELWRHGEGGNNVISPVSIASALVMAWTGARGQTEEQMRKVLHVDSDVSRVAREWNQVAQLLRRETPGVTLALANRLFGERGYTFDPAFVARLADAFGAPMETLDFAGAPAAACAHINQWVEAQTQKHITNLLPEPAITSLTRLVLVNAVFFLGKWLQAFKPADTVAKPFWIGAKQSTDVPTMHMTGLFRMAAIEGGEMIELPYEGATTAMYIVVPTARDGLPRIERDLDGDSLARWSRGLHPMRLALALPRFKAAPPGKRLDGDLKALGMKLAFDPSGADFSNMARPASPNEELFISAVFHKAFVETDEAGTKAAAATGVVMASRGGAPKPPRPFVVDRPFVFFIADIASGLILFMGRISAP